MMTSCAGQPGLKSYSDCQVLSRSSDRGVQSSLHDRPATIRAPRSAAGFTLVEMIMVIVITGIIGGIVAVFIKAPVQQYVDVARRADMTDIADTALRRVTRDLRLALPNSVRVRNAAGTPCADPLQACFLEFIPTIGGGRYRDATDNLGAGDILDFAAADPGFDVLGTMPPVAVGDQIVVYNLGIPGADAYAGNAAANENRRAVTGVAGNFISIASVNALPFDSCIYDSGFVVGGCRFQVVQAPVTYVCDPVARTLIRWQEVNFQAVQPVVLPAGQAVLASNVTACSFTYDPIIVAQRSGLVTMNLAIEIDGETVTLYNASHVSNQP